MMQVNNVNMVLVKNVYDSDTESDSPGIFIIFFKILIFGIIRGEVKGQKMAQNNNNFCLSQCVSQEPYII